MNLAIFSRHPRRLLSAYVNDEVSPADAKRIAEHLETCPRCRAEYKTIAFGARAASRLPKAERPPEAVWNAIQLHLHDAERAAARNGRRRLWRTACAAAAAAFIVVTAVGVWSLNRSHAPQIHLRASTSAHLTSLERAARDLYLDAAAGDVPLDLAGDVPRAISDWARRRHGLHVDLADARPPQDAGRYQVIGAKTVPVGDHEGVLVTYRVGSAPVALITARAEDLADAPREEWFAKAVTHRSDPDARVKILTWTRKGQAYALASALPNVGEESCFICHVATARRNLIRTLATEVRE